MAGAKTEVEGLMLRLLADLGCAELIDATVFDYACGVLQSIIDEDGGEDEENLAHLDALLVGACGEPYEAHTEAERQEQWAKLVQEVGFQPSYSLWRIHYNFNVILPGDSFPGAPYPGGSLGSGTAGRRHCDSSTSGNGTFAEQLAGPG
ncbi:hypothetical protein Vretimale_3418 [Volvox reticuliferus]|uniref:Uncharacterized protein n=1 Tax=Volvox reticuliferus TaxID=1737510 RepID=A0A8J4FGT1_9CHLO|nr:hypothetical protein Vretifemale_1098 [Volvox reticuliferus]GIL97993.1 hypothetical protein Vretimale_3418 [Volvox reticuliferus]